MMFITVTTTGALAEHLRKVTVAVGAISHYMPNPTGSTLHLITPHPEESNVWFHVEETPEEITKLLNPGMTIGEFMAWAAEKDEPEPTYKIVRHFRDDLNPSTVVETGLTLEEAQAHCRKPETRTEDWFDGYEEET